MTLLGAKLAAARAAGAVSRRAGRGGTSLPGKLLLRLEPGAVGSLAARLSNGSRGHLGDQRQDDDGRDGRVDPRARRARAGAQPRRARTWPAGSPARCWRPPGRAASIAGDTGLFEIDEFWLDRLVPQIRPRALLLANLFRDQLDRYGELETIADRWAGVVAQAKDTTLVLNADDPLVADLGRDRAGVVYFGVEDPSMALEGMAHAADSKHCRRCGAPYRYDYVFLGHLGHYHCDACGATRPGADGRGRARGARRPARRARDAAAAGRRPSRSRCPSPGSTTSTTRSAPPR